jgi:hypothetical protein
LLVASLVHAEGPHNTKEQAMVAQLQKAYAAHGLTMTPAQEEQFLQRYRKLEGDAIQDQALATAEGQGAPAQEPAAMTSAAVTSRATLDRMVRERETTPAPTTFERRPDGFLADGRPVVDAQGRIVQFGGNAATGDVTYFVDQGHGNYLVRFTNIHSALPAVTVGALVVDSGYRFTAIDGEQINGEEIIPTGRGVVVARTGTLFNDTFGESVDTQSLPADYALAPLQHGDVAGTGYVLLRRLITDSEKTNPIQGLGQLFKSVAGRGDDRDYALFNVHTGHVVYLNRSESTDKVGHGNDCHAKTRLVSSCGGWSSQEEMFQSDGVPNLGHYYWGVQWMGTAQGPTAVVMENGMREVNVIRLDSGARANVFTRGLGITSFLVQPTADGSLSVTGKWMFQDHIMADVQTLFEAPRPTSG